MNGGSHAHGQRSRVDADISRLLMQHELELCHPCKEGGLLCQTWSPDPGPSPPLRSRGHPSAHRSPPTSHAASNLSPPSEFDSAHGFGPQRCIPGGLETISVNTFTLRVLGLCLNYSTVPSSHRKQTQTRSKRVSAAGLSLGTRKCAKCSSSFVLCKHLKLQKTCILR